MEITKRLVKEFISIVPLKIERIDKEVMCVGVRWGYTESANDDFGKHTVLRILVLLENNKEYQKLLPK